MTTLYRLFDADDALLYVGIAGNPGRRFEQHAKAKLWWREVSRIEVEHFADRAEALAAERLAIRDERPLYNIVHSVRVLMRPGDVVLFPCAGCGQLIDEGPGHLQVDNAEVAQHELEREEWERRHPDDEFGGKLLTIADLKAFPALARWQAWHWDCDPDHDSSAYAIHVERIRTPRDVIAWTAHLMEKDWLTATDWSELLHNIGSAANEGGE